MALYTIWNGPAPTTAAQVPVTTGTAIKTLLQVQASATNPLKIGRTDPAFVAQRMAEARAKETQHLFGSLQRPG